MKRIILFCVLLVCAINPIHANAQQEDFIIVGILGQSNAAGYAICPDVLPDVPDGIYNFGNDYVLHLAQEPIDLNIGQVDMVSYDAVNRCGPALPLAISLHNITGKSIILVPCARGGSFIVQWLPSYSRDTLYGSCLHRLQTANTGNYKVMLFFYQGESDAYSLSSAAAWDERFVTIIHALQSDLDNPLIVFVQLGRTSDYVAFPYMYEVAAEQSKVILPDVSMVMGADELSLGSAVHLDYESISIIGERAASLLYYLSKTEGE